LCTCRKLAGHIFISAPHPVAVGIRPYGAVSVRRHYHEPPEPGPNSDFRANSWHHRFQIENVIEGLQNRPTGNARHSHCAVCSGADAKMGDPMGVSDVEAPFRRHHPHADADVKAISTPSVLRFPLIDVGKYCPRPVPGHPRLQRADRTVLADFREDGGRALFVRKR
jgi:hypothetical protein